MRRSIHPQAPLWTLALLAPAVGELLGMSTSPVSFFNPRYLILLIVLYGGGAILCREAMVRTGSGWRGLLLLGLGYGVLEEAIASMSWFNPNWPDLQELIGYGWVFGVNSMWALHSTIYHATISIAVPVLIVELLYPTHRGNSLLNETALRLWLSGVTAVIVIICADTIRVTGFTPAPWHFLLALVLSAGFIRLGLNPMVEPVTLPTKSPTPLWSGLFFLVGFITSTVLHLIVRLAPLAHWAPWAAAGLYVLICWGATALLIHMTWHGHHWTNRAKMALATGVLSFFVLVDMFIERTSRTDDPMGKALVATAFGVGLLAVYVLIRTREKERIGS